MLKKITFKAGSGPNQPPLSFDLTPVTIFVGPNNSGKSRALVEIEHWMTRPTSSDGIVIQDIVFKAWERDEFEAEIAKITVSPALNEIVHLDHFLVSKLKPQDNTSPRFQLHMENLIDEALTPNGRSRLYYSSFLSMYTLRLDGRGRLSLIEDLPTGDMIANPINHLGKLFSDPILRQEVRRIVFDSFGKYLVVDPTNVGTYRLRLADRPPADEAEEQSWDARARKFHSQATLLSECSDGIKAFVGMITTLIAGEPITTLIDEPEAFLHPTLANRLGKEVSTALKGTTKQLFVSTHSASFLMGCVQAGAAVNIVRLTYDGRAATARLMSKERLIPLMRNPLLRSIGVLDALFYNAVVVTEADADRAFYQEINNRLLQAQDTRGIDGCLFLNAQNKQTVWDIVHPLRELGIPAIGIVDIDVLKEGGVVWAKPMRGAFVPDISHGALGNQRAAFLNAFQQSGKDMKRDGGIGLLSAPDQEACRSFFGQLSEYGIFVVPNGEIESWLPELKISRNKSGWLNSIFEAMGEDSTTSGYTRPQSGDVWEFMGRIAEWVKNPSRKGIPN